MRTTHLKSCADADCVHNRDHHAQTIFRESKGRILYRPTHQCTLKEVNMVISYGRSTDYAEVFMCKEAKRE